jgi:hypothetical protein
MTSEVPAKEQHLEAAQENEEYRVYAKREETRLGRLLNMASAAMVMFVNPPPSPEYAKARLKFWGRWDREMPAAPAEVDINAKSLEK